MYLSARPEWGWGAGEGTPDRKVLQADHQGSGGGRVEDGGSFWKTWSPLCLFIVTIAVWLSNGELQKLLILSTARGALSC